MNHCVLSIWPLALLCCVGIAGQSVTVQSAEPDCNGTPPAWERETHARAEFDVWLESLDRRPCAGPQDPVRPGVVSVQSLAHRPPRKARQEFDRGMRARSEGRAAEAEEHFVAAASLDPSFVDAHAQAGLVYVEARQPYRALPHYQQAVRLEPANAALLSNLASVLIALYRPAEAEAPARRAVRLAPSSVEAHYLLGFALFGQGKATEETASHLTIAAKKYSLAREMLASFRLVFVRPPGSASDEAVHF